MIGSLGKMAAIRRAGGRALGAAELSEAELVRLLDDPDKPLWRHMDRPVKIDHARLIVEAELQLGRRTARVAYRRYREKSWWKLVLGLLRRSRARRAWDLGQTLLRRGIPTARPMAVMEPSPWRHLGQSYLATQWIERAENLHLYGWRLASFSSFRRHRLAGRCAESLGSMIGRMHAQGIGCRDLKAANLLVVETADRTETYLIDTDGLRQKIRLRRGRRVADLARLAASMQAHPWVPRSVYWRFLAAYITQSPDEPVGRKTLWRDVTRLSRQIVARKRRHGKPLL